MLPNQKIQSNKASNNSHNYWHKPIGKITIAIIAGTIVLVIGFSITHFMNPSKQQEINAPNSIISINQQGGTTAHTVNNINEFPEPKFDMKLISVNIPKNDLFETKALLTIESRTALKNLYLEAKAPSIVTLEVIPQRTGMSMSGLSGKRNGFAFTNLPGAWGQYILVILSQKPEKFEIIYNYE